MQQTKKSLLLALALLSGCPDGGNPDRDDPLRDLASPDLACFAAPVSHVEILNACTTAQSVDKRPVLPLLSADGTLPPLP